MQSRLLAATTCTDRALAQPRHKSGAVPRQLTSAVSSGIRGVSGTHYALPAASFISTRGAAWWSGLLPATYKWNSHVTAGDGYHRDVQSREPAKGATRAVSIQATPKSKGALVICQSFQLHALQQGQATLSGTWPNSLQINLAPKLQFH